MLSTHGSDPELEPNRPDLPQPELHVYRSTLHSMVVKACLYCVVWPAIIIHSFLTILTLMAFQLFPMSVIGWWGIGSLLWMHRFFAGKDTPPDNAAWYGLITASLLVAWMAQTWFEGMEWFYVLIACIPVAAYWAWLSKKNFRLWSASGATPGA